ncbi:hypothetical protein I0P70_02520 [Pontibacter sp. FD36]|uniref:hypothetical protein n=1 Tax=Pontibacter sp. FD36 TaxID=2789860 RepID=UPI0018ABFCD9|nr:hypothetical protein [Pontibacter sp. FD36]MBF8962108.1 hypothetical protein [Pontibacter sp. FD36]
MKQLLRLLLGIIPCLFLACDYSPSGSHYEDLNPNPEVVADITLHEHQDTILIRGNKNLHFSVSLPGRVYHGFQLKLGNQVIAEGNNPGSVLFRSAQYRDGYHTLKFSAVSNSGTGSLADKHGAELLEINRTWVILIDNAGPSPVAITSIVPVKGQLRVEWQQYKRPGFHRYELYRVLGEGGHERVATFQEITSTS